MSLAKSTLGEQSFSKKYSFDKRLSEAERVLAKYPDRIPVIVERYAGQNTLPVMDKQKFLVPNDLTVGQFVYIIRKRIKLSSDKAIFIMIDNQLPPTSSLLSQIYETSKNKDKFLYMKYSSENVFG